MTTTNAYATRDQLRAHLGYVSTEIDDDTPLDLALNAASRQIDGTCGWRFWQDPTVVVREFYPDSPYGVEFADADRDGISTTTGLIVKVDYDGDGTYETTLTSGTDFLLQPRNAPTRVPVWPYTSLQLIRSAQNYFPRSLFGRPTIQITAKWGWPAIPDDITQACLIQAALLAESKLAVFGAIALGDTAARNVQAALNPIARALVGPYSKPAVG